MEKLSEKITNFSGKFAAYEVIFLVFLTFFQVMARYWLTPLEFFDPFLKILNPILLQELQWHLFAFIFLVGAAFTLASDDHVRVDVLYQKMTEKIKNRLNFWGFFCLFLPFCFWVLWTSIPYAFNNFWDGTPNPGGIPVWGWVKLLMPLGMILLLLEAGKKVAKDMKNIPPS